MTGLRQSSWREPLNSDEVALRLAAARRRLSPLHRQAPAASGLPPRTGEIRKVLPMDPGVAPALVLVSGGDEGQQAHTVLLLTPDVELCGDRDLVLWPEDTGLPYAVAVQTDVFSYVWTVQLEPALGQVDTALLRALKGLQAAEPDLPIPDRRAGASIASRRDARWIFKEQELARLQAVSADCTRQLVDGPPHLLIDPVGLRPPEPGTDPLDALEFISTLADGIANGAVDAPAWLIDRVLSDSGLAAAYRSAGLFDGYQVLVRLAEGLLLRVGDETVPEAADGAGNVLSSLEQARLEVLTQERGHGHSSAWLLTRKADVGPAPRAERFWSDGHMIQCVRTWRA